LYLTSFSTAEDIKSNIICIVVIVAVIMKYKLVNFLLFVNLILLYSLITGLIPSSISNLSFNSISINSAFAQSNTHLHILVLGDSVAWGQGLYKEQKFYSIVANKIKSVVPDIQIDDGDIQVLAHSGAPIGKDIQESRPPLHGEIPYTYPTILQQVDEYNGDPLNVNLVLLTACSDDVDAPGKVSNPQIPTNTIHQLTDTYCHHDMALLLKKITNKFTNAKVIVTGYPLVISPRTDMDKAKPLLALLSCGAYEVLGICLQNLEIGIYNHVITNWAAFYDDVLGDIQKAIDECCKNQVYLVNPGYNWYNAIFTPHDSKVFDAQTIFGPWFLYFPVDPIADVRESWCKTDVPSDWQSQNKCNLSSLGHPNVQGAQQYADAIMNKLVSEGLIYKILPKPNINEDCIKFNPQQASIQNIGGSWKVVVGNMWMLDFGGNQAAAQKALDIIRHYSFTSQCFVGRPNAPMMYFLVSENAPQGQYVGQDCNSFNPNTISVQNINSRYKIVDGNHWMLDFTTSQTNANNALDIIKKYGFDNICFVERPNPPMMYFLNNNQSGIPDTTPPDTIITSAIDKNGNPVIRSGFVDAAFDVPVTFTFTGTDNKGISKFECSFNGATSICTSPISYNNLSTAAPTPLNSTNNKFNVTAIDTSGNRDPTPAVVDFYGQNG